MMKATEINECLKGKLLQQGNELNIEKFLFDSRKISHPTTSIFVPIVSERRNAHKFIQEVYDAGVRFF